MRVATDHGNISPEQYIRPQHSSVNHEIDRRLVFDYQLYIRQPLSLVSNDLDKSYYIIFLSAARLSLQRLGITLLSIIIKLDQIQRMSHTIRTSYGDLKITYGGDTIPDKFRHFFMGLFEINGNAPQVWSNISSVVFSALRAQVF